MAPGAAGAGETVDQPFSQVTESDRNARIRLLLERLGGMVAHLDHLGRRHDVETVGRTTLRSQNGPDLLFVAEQDDTALRTETFEGHDGPFDGCLGSVIAAHGINTNL